MESNSPLANEKELRQIKSFTDVKPTLLKILYEDSHPLFNKLFKIVEKKGNIKREHVSYIFESNNIFL